MNHLAHFEQSLAKPSLSREQLINKFVTTRQHTCDLVSNLEKEDFVVQPMAEVSPPKWHLAHTTWFFEELILQKNDDSYDRFNEGFKLLFNSYYKAAGPHWIQSDRGNLSRPTVSEVFEYRSFVDEKVLGFLRQAPDDQEIDFLLEVGIHHEQQHQELLLMDIKAILGANPIFPAYSRQSLPVLESSEEKWVDFTEGLYEVGYSGDEFSFDNEGPRHKTYLQSFSVREKAVTNGEFLEFMNRQGYCHPSYWLSDGWDWVEREKVSSPMYWYKKDDQWFEFTLHGLLPLDLQRPVTHISYFEADAYAQWAGYRLLNESEAEVYLQGQAIDDKKEFYHPSGESQQNWFWTRSSYSSYPGYQTFPGFLGEYNGKFMCNQYVLRGGCFATPKKHYRHTYRNFYRPHQRWMFSGLRLGKDL